MSPEIMQGLERLAEGEHPAHNWPIRASQVTMVEYVGIKGRRRPVHARLVHPPRVGDHIRWMHFRKKSLDFSFSYHEVTQVLWDVRSNVTVRPRAS
jgi:hypothetical protein